MNKELHSPIYKGGSVNRVEFFNTSKIINAYNSMGIDVSRFFKNFEKIELYECINTGYRFYYPFSAIGDADFYKELSLKRKNYYSTRWEHLEILPSIKKNENVLEIGSGFGAFLNLLKAKGVYSEGIELNPEAVDVCKKEGLIIHNELIESFTIKFPEKYDVVCYFQVLEHITNVHDFIKNSLKALKPNGKLIIGVPNNNPFLFITDKYHSLNLPPHHAGLWNIKALLSLCDIFPLKVEEIYYEPLALNYQVFLNSYIKNSNFLMRQALNLFRKLSPSLLKKILCKFIHGRNILVVFKKVGE